MGKCADIAAVSLPLGHFLGRIGCFFAGCCYGKTCDLPWAVTFNDPESLAQPLHVPLHPTQLYALLLTVILLDLELAQEGLLPGSPGGIVDNATTPADGSIIPRGGELAQLLEEAKKAGGS